MRINTSALGKIHDHYDANHDVGPEAPVLWSVEQLAQVVGQLVEVIEAQDERITSLETIVDVHLDRH